MVQNTAEKVTSEWRSPVNKWMNLPNSIHNEEVATKIGMRGGTIPGTVHLNHFVPLIQEVWGRAWYERGTISMYYTFATTHLEQVRAVIAQPSGDAADKVDALVETPEGKIVCKGSLSVGDIDEPNYVSSLALENSDPGELRILAGLEPGMACDPTDTVITQDGTTSESDGFVVNPTGMYSMLNASFPRGIIRKAVGFFGATEIRLVNGPIRLDTQYRREGKVICVGASPKTEYGWVDSVLLAKGTDEVVAEMRHLTRWMKASSELWSNTEDSESL